MPIRFSAEMKIERKKYNIAIVIYWVRGFDWLIKTNNFLIGWRRNN